MDAFEALEGWQRLDGFAGLRLGEADLIKALQIQPEFRCGAKEMGQTQGRVAGDGAAPIQDFGDAIGGNIQLPRQLGGAHAQLFQLFRQMFARVNWNYCHYRSRNGHTSGSSQSVHPSSVTKLPDAVPPAEAGSGSVVVFTQDLTTPTSAKRSEEHTSELQSLRH